MALHPFRTFQRNQKAWLAGIGIATMISFIILPVLLQLFTRGGSTVDTLAKCRRFGDVTNQTIHFLNEDRETLRRFVYVLYEKLAEPGDETKMNSLRPLMQFVRQFDQRQDIEGMVNDWLLSQYAKSQGLQADWAVVKDLLRELTASYLTDSIYRDTLQNVGISHQRVQYLLGEEIIRRQLLERFQQSVEPQSPATRWDWYGRMNRKVQIEAVAVPVEQFVGQVKDPSKAELQNFFEEHKKQRDDAASPEVGFIEPAELGLQYVIAEPDKKLLDSITDDEIKTFYEANKASLFVKPEQPASPERELPGLPGLGGSSVPFPAPQKPVQNTEPKSEKPQKEEPKPETPATPAEPQKEEPAKPEVKPDESPTTSMSSTITAKLVKYQAEPAASGSPDGTAKPEDAVTIVPTPAAQTVQYAPLDEVKSEIRTTLAHQKLAAVITKIQDKMKEYAKVYNESFESGKTAPPIPDLTAFVAENGLQLNSVPAGTLFQNLKNEFARGLQERQRLFQLYAQTPMLFETDVFAGSKGDVLIWLTATKAEKKPENFADVEATVLKRWKEVQARPLAKEQAEKLAAEAKLAQKSLSDVFKDKDGITVVDTEAFSWKTYGAGIHPLTALMQGMRPVLDEVREQGVAVGNSFTDNKVIQLPGEDFMKAVFSLSVGEIAVTLNQPETLVYVVRMTSSSPSEDVLWERFQTAYPLEYVYAGQPEVSAAAYKAWLAGVYSETGFSWLKKPDEQ
jgi:hypothetical protein